MGCGGGGSSREAREGRPEAVEWSRKWPGSGNGGRGVSDLGSPACVLMASSVGFVMGWLDARCEGTQSHCTQQLAADFLAEKGERAKVRLEVLSVSHQRLWHSTCATGGHIYTSVKWVGF